MIHNLIVWPWRNIVRIFKQRDLVNKVRYSHI